MNESYRWEPGVPGRLDVNGVEWWACDPYPTWYRWDDGELLLDHAEWASPNSLKLVEPVTLFQTGAFILHSGEDSAFKIECDALTDHDWATLARLIVTRVPPFGEVEGVASGGLQLAAELEVYATEGPLLIVDDVLTVGTSMERQRAGREAIGAVVFARQECPDWITPLFTMAAPFND